MNLLDSTREFLQELDEQQFYKYLLGTCIALVSVMGLMIYRYYRVTSILQKKISNVNEQREDDVKKILERSKQLQQARTTVDETLAKNPDFKIKGYYNNLIAKLNLQSVSSSADPSYVDRDANYRESILRATFTGMNMQQLTELLKELEQTDRISTKELEIKKAKSGSAIDVVLTIGTLHLKAPE